MSSRENGPDDGQGAPPVPIRGLTPQTLPGIVELLSPASARFVTACSFKGEPGQTILVPGDNGALACVFFGVEARDAPRRDPFLAGKLVGALPPGRYSFAEGFESPELSALGFELSTYRFTRFRASDMVEACLEVPAGVDARRLNAIAKAVAFGRDLINRPANDLGPVAFEAAARELAEAYGARFRTIIGDDLFVQNLPMIHAVGRAAAEEPRLADFSWGDAAAPKVTLVGKGVCFDTGGLDIKPEAAMLLMKKDMGGAAAALALAAMVMSEGLPIRLRVILPIVENAIAGNAFRPGDVLRSRKGLSVEIGNTDAEGRLILADALTLADEERPDLLFDFATLTGAARVALGPDLPPFYTMDDDLAAAIASHAVAVHDPVWRMPLWDPYDGLLKSKVADLSNVSTGPFAGSITAALFLRRFVEATPSWAHFDVYGWNPTTKPGHPEGGEVQVARALFDLLRKKYGSA